MIPFDKIALALLKELGLEADVCKTEEEAKEKASQINTSLRGSSPKNEEYDRSNLPAHALPPQTTSLTQSPNHPITQSPTSWPIYFFGSDTSGEKSFEEFYTEKEILDTESFINLGVIKNSVKRNIAEIDEIFNNLETLFKKETVTKQEIVEALSAYLPNFAHIETGKGLDMKM